MGFPMDRKEKVKATCGAMTRQGMPCRNTRIYKNGRCKNHGGLSTGPKTAGGKLRALANLKKAELSA
ncbi:hypothetical protein GEOBRER4_n1642 [Citrifermentans bremense]|uniref:Uncharacterized protein n=1 Tax=Citrifermentans bremense TaxID=60035 RepID=A0A7R7FS45_9BACT|nr:hypothetical protein GEOBRER4_n1642 [Citrifermentans bremense]